MATKKHYQIVKVGGIRSGDKIDYDLGECSREQAIKKYTDYVQARTGAAVFKLVATETVIGEE